MEFPASYACPPKPQPYPTQIFLYNWYFSLYLRTWFLMVLLVGMEFERLSLFPGVTVATIGKISSLGTRKKIIFSLEGFMHSIHSQTYICFESSCLSVRVKTGLIFALHVQHLTSSLSHASSGLQHVRWPCNLLESYQNPVKFQTQQTGREKRRAGNATAPSLKNKGKRW